MFWSSSASLFKTAAASAASEEGTSSDMLFMSSDIIELLATRRGVYDCPERSRRG
jgi:hypothetical protein